MKLFFISIIFIPLICFAQTGLQSFTFTAKGQNLVVHYNSSLAKIINEPLADPEWDEGTLRILETQLSPKNPQLYILQFDGSPSFEPTFQLFMKTEHSMNLVESFKGRNISIPGDGFIYVRHKGKRRKFEIVEKVKKM